MKYLCRLLARFFFRDITELNLKLDTLDMKLSQIKADIAAASKQSKEAFAELGSKVASLQKQVDDLIAGASDPDVTDQQFLDDLTTLKTNVAQLADLVPNTAPEPPVA